MKSVKEVILAVLLIMGITDAFGKAAFYTADWQKSKKEIRNQQIPVMGFIGGTVLIKADSDKIVSLKGCDTRLIDQDFSAGNYYLASKNNPESKLETPNGVKAIYRGESTLLIKGSASISTLIAADFNITPLPEKPMILPTEDLVAPAIELQPKNQQITDILAEVRQDSILSYIKFQQNMQTRFLHAPNRRIVAEKIRQKFIQLGCTEAVLDSFYLPAYTAYTDNIAYPASWQYNVVATITGTSNADEFIVLSGHHDSIVLKPGQDPFVFAPGADDNASAVAAILETCRVMKKKNYQPKRSIKFISFTAEEHGLLGSKDYANKVHAAGMKIKAVLNSDLIAYNLDTPNNWKVRFITYPAYEDLHQTAIRITKKYTTLQTGTGGIENTRSDSYSFVLNGYPGIWYFENPFNPYYHSIQETWDKLDMPYCTEIIKAKCALAIYKNEAPDNVTGLKITDKGNGFELLVRWNKSKETDVNHYKISIGTATEVYTQSFTTTDTVYTINNLQNNQLYFVGVSVVDNDNYESMLTENTATPLAVPTSPTGVLVESDWQKVKLNWTANPEMDIFGYNVYRSTNNQDFTKINTATVTTTSFQDNNCDLSSYLYYRITAVDNTNNESSKSLSSLPVRPVTLTNGIMIIDDSPNGSGIPSSPNELMQDQFYNSLTANCPAVSNYDIAANNKKISLSELGPFSTVIWHNQAVELGSVFNTYLPEITKYLDFGGKLLIFADKPAKLIESCNTYPTGFSVSSVINSYFGIDSANYKTTARFSGAIPAVSGYNYLEVDSAKALESNGFHLKKIETLHAKSGATVIYKYDSDYATTVNYGASKNQPVGVFHSGSNYKTATLAIPTYFIKQEPAKIMVEYVLKEKFGEIVSINDTEYSIANFELAQNYPNPFNPTTIISFSLATTDNVKLKIYDANGREIASLINAQMNSGKHDYKFSATDLSSGVYFYSLQVGNHKEVKKMIFTK